MRRLESDLARAVLFVDEAVSFALFAILQEAGNGKDEDGIDACKWICG